MKKIIVIPALLLTLLLLTACPDGGSMRSMKKYMGLKGNPVSLCERQFNEDGESVDALVYTFDKAGEVLRITSYGPDGRESYRVNNAYDKKGVLVSVVTRSPFGDEVLNDLLKKRSGGREVWERRRGGASFTTEYSGSDTNRTIVRKRGDEVVSTEEYRLDTDGNTLEAKIMRDGRLVLWTQSEYDDQGNETLTRNLQTPTDPVKTYIYDGFDADGNWTKRTTLSEGMPTASTMREISYEEPAEKE